MRRIALIVSVGLFTLCGCDNPAKRFPPDPDELTLYSIDGVSMWKEIAPTPAQIKAGLLFGSPVLGKVDVTDPELRRQVMAAVIGDTNKNPPMAACFYPRHALRVKKGEEVYHIVICFQCSNYESYHGDEKATRRGGPISSESKPLLNRILSEAGVPLMKDGDD